MQCGWTGAVWWCCTCGVKQGRVFLLVLPLQVLFPSEGPTVQPQWPLAPAAVAVHRSIAALLPCCSAALLLCCSAALLLCCSAALLLCCSAALLLLCV